MQDVRGDLMGVVLSMRPQKTQSTCHCRCGLIKISTCSSAVSSEQIPTFCSLHRQWWRLHTHENICKWDVKQYTINQDYHNTFYDCLCTEICRLNTTYDCLYTLAQRLNTTYDCLCTICPRCSAIPDFYRFLYICCTQRSGNNTADWMHSIYCKGRHLLKSRVRLQNYHRNDKSSTSPSIWT